MANTRSAKKAIRQSAQKKSHNLFWKKQIKDILKEIARLRLDGKEADIISAKIAGLYKVVDKAAKNNVIHKNKANRIKAKATKTTAKEKSANEVTKSAKKTKTTAKKAGAKRKPAAKSKSKSKS